jgi:hypothetical protein
MKSLDTISKKLAAIEARITTPRALITTKENGYDILRWRGQTVKILREGLMETL